MCDKLEVFDTHGGGGLGFRSQMIGDADVDAANVFQMSPSPLQYGAV